MSTVSHRVTPEYVSRRQRIITATRSAYQDILIAYDERYGHVLYLDDDLQIAESDQAYNQAMVDPIADAGLLDHILILGGGDGGVLQRALELGARRATLVDIDSKVIALSRDYLTGLCKSAFDHPRARVVVGDAFAWLDEGRDAPYSAIIYDLTMEPVREDQSRLAFIDEIIRRMRDRLIPGGMITMQCCSGHDKALARDVRMALARSFPYTEQRTVTVPSYWEPWIFASARLEGSAGE
ncbi:MAG: spermine synthase [Ectothiorhodospiraceae bacterium]|nr:spermine synthase [Ectothiorhodospiraceae bacterium]